MEATYTIKKKEHISNRTKVVCVSQKDVSDIDWTILQNLVTLRKSSAESMNSYEVYMIQKNNDAPFYLNENILVPHEKAVLYSLMKKAEEIIEK